MHDFVVSQICHNCTFRQFRDGQADDQPKGKHAVDQALPKLCLRGKILVDMQGLAVHRERGEEDVIHFRNSAACMLKFHPHFEFVKVFAWHKSSF
jgi:hypothetical protein